MSTTGAIAAKWMIASYTDILRNGVIRIPQEALKPSAMCIKNPRIRNGAF